MLLQLRNLGQDSLVPVDAPLIHEYTYAGGDYQFSMPLICFPLAFHSGRILPEHAVADFIHFPRTDERDISDNCWFPQISSAVMIQKVFLVSWDLDASFQTTWVVSDRDFSFLYGGMGTRGSVEEWHARSLCADTRYERTLRDELEGNLAFEIKGFEMLVSVSEC